MGVRWRGGIGERVARPRWQRFCSVMNGGSNVIRIIFRFLALSVGLVGFVVCVAVGVATWFVGARVHLAADEVFGAVDGALAAVERRVVQTHERTESLVLTTQGMEEEVRNWLQAEIPARVGAKIDVEQQAERLAAGLDQVDHWLELAESSVQLVQQALEVGSSLGASIETEPVERLLEELTRIRTQLAEADEPVERIRGWASEAGDEELREERFGQIAQLAVRVTATLGLIDTALERIESRLSEIRTATRQAHATAQWWIRVARLGVLLVVGWMAAGQIALCWLGWKGRGVAIGAGES